MSQDKLIDVTGRYSQEIRDIEHLLNNLQNENIYEKTGARMDGYLSTNISKLKKQLSDLISKIEYGKKSVNEEIQEALKGKEI